MFHQIWGLLLFWLESLAMITRLTWFCVGLPSFCRRVQLQELLFIQKVRFWVKVLECAFFIESILFCYWTGKCRAAWRLLCDLCRGANVRYVDGLNASGEWTGADSTASSKAVAQQVHQAAFAVVEVGEKVLCFAIFFFMSKKGLHAMVPWSDSCIDIIKIAWNVVERSRPSLASWRFVYKEKFVFFFFLTLTFLFFKLLRMHWSRFQICWRCMLEKMFELESAKWSRLLLSWLKRDLLFKFICCIESKVETSPETCMHWCGGHWPRWIVLLHVKCFLRNQMESMWKSSSKLLK